jgi:hypothetical protein
VIKVFNQRLVRVFQRRASQLFSGKARWCWILKRLRRSQTIVSEHQPVVMTPERAKAFKKILENNIENYEEKHGEIELPEREDSKDSEIEESQDYIG